MTAVLLALASALAFATATVVQHRSAAEAAMGGGRFAAVGLMSRLLRHPAWLAGQAAAVVGLTLHALALHAGRVVLVQPLLSSGLVLSLLLGALVDRRHADRRLPEGPEWAAAGLVAVGLTTFLVSARPAGGADVARPFPMLGCVLGALLFAGAAAGWSARPGARHRTLVLASASGVGFGVAGLLLKEVVAQPLARWPALVALIGVGAVSIVLSQWAYRSGSLIQSLPVMTVLEPLVAILASGPLFGERLAPGAAAHTGQLVGVLGLGIGVALLSRRTARRETGLPATAGVQAVPSDTSSSQGGRARERVPT
ncbi:MAG TPA: DMT family transporter [Modestobacter sp.]|nr:DMT family transporter [Modestobacter sp.]